MNRNIVSTQVIESIENDLQELILKWMPEIPDIEKQMVKMQMRDRLLQYLNVKNTRTYNDN